MKSHLKKVGLKFAFKNSNTVSCPQVFRAAAPQTRTRDMKGP